MLQKNNNEATKDRPRPTSGRPSYLRGPVPQRQPGVDDQDTQTKEAASVQEKDQITEDVELYTWTNWLLPRRPLISALVVGSLIGCIALAYWAVPQLFFVAVITVILINRLALYLFPVKFILTEQTVGYKTFLARDIREWERFLAYREFPDGVFLTHDTRTFRGRMKEGIFLYYYDDCSNKEQVLSIVESKLKPLHEALSAEDEKKQKKGGLRSAIERIRRIRSKK